MPLASMTEQCLVSAKCKAESQNLKRQKGARAGGVRKGKRSSKLYSYILVKRKQKEKL